MPGFIVGGSGGPGPANTVETLREHRWLISEFGPISPNSLLIAKEVTLPTGDIEEQQILGGLIWYKFAKAVKWDDATVVFYDDANIEPEIEKWKKLVYDNSSGIGKHNPSSGYKKKCTFQLLGGDGSVLQQVVLNNAWPKRIAHGKLSYTSSEIKMITVTMAFDWAEVTS